MYDSKKNSCNGIKENNDKLRMKFGKQIQINELILLRDGRLCSTSNDDTITIYDKYNYQIQTKIKLKSMIEDIVDLSGGLIVKQKYAYELDIYRKKDFKFIQFINHQYVVETIFEVNKKLIICTKYRSDIGIEIWEKNKNNLYKLTGFLVSNLLSSYCLINEDKNKSNIFFCENPLSKGLKDDKQVMQAKEKMDQEYSKLKDQKQKMIKEREELKNKIKLLDEQIYQLDGGHEEKFNYFQKMPHNMQLTFQGIQQQYYHNRFGQIKYFQPNPQGMMGMQTHYQINKSMNPMMYQMKQMNAINPMNPMYQMNPVNPINPTQPGFQYKYDYHGSFNPTLFWENPQFYQQHQPWHGQYNPNHEEHIQNLLKLDGDLSWKESTKFSTNILINYSRNTIKINLDEDYLNTKIYAIKANENKLVTAFIYKNVSPTIISIKICDLKNHIGKILVIESRRNLNFIDSIININGSYILFGVWFINIDARYEIVFKLNFFGNIYDKESHFLKKCLKLLNGNILIYAKDNNDSGEYKFENNRLIKIRENFIEDANIIIEKNEKEIITYSNNLLKLWEKVN